MAADDLDLMPEPPHARPARRDAAIEAALRRFDGEPTAAPASSAPRPASWSRHPQLGVALAASLVIVIGIPAAVIALRDQGPAPANLAPPPRVPTDSGAAPDAAAGNDMVSPPAAQQRQRMVETRSQSGAPVPKPEAKAAIDETGPSIAQAAPPPVIAAAPPPPPPAAPSPPMLAEKSADAAGSDVVVTGSRVARSNAQREESEAASPLAAVESPTAAEWVLRDQSYATFLSNLQSAVRAGDRGAMIRLIRFPLRVNFSGGSRVYRDASSVRADYDRIFSARVRRAILAQRFDRLYGGSRGLMVGSGEIWFDHACPNGSCSPPGPVRITAVNP